MTRKQHGFSAVEGLLIITVIGLLGLASWYVWHAKQTKTATKATTATTNTAQPTQKEAFKLPAGYTPYANSSLGFTFAYPTEWRELATPTDTNFTGYTAFTPEIQNIGIGDSRLQGRFGFTKADAASFTMSTSKYGALVTPITSGAGYQWKVTEVNPADTTDTVGDIYAVKTLKSASGVTLYDFSWQDEGATHGTWAFKAGDQFISVSLPAILGTDLNAVPAKDLALYNSLARNIQASIAVTK